MNIGEWKAVTEQVGKLEAENKQLREALTKTEADNEWLRLRIKSLKAKPDVQGDKNA